MKYIVGNGKHGQQAVLIDEEDLIKVSSYSWCLSKESRGSKNSLLYAVGWEPPRLKGKALIRMHRLIMGAQKGQVVDHINGNTLDNRKSNLRLTSHRVNMQNSRKRKNATSKYKGVSWHGAKQVWRSRLYMDGKHYYLGVYHCEESAARAYDAALEMYGSASPRNFPNDLILLK